MDRFSSFGIALAFALAITPTVFAQEQPGTPTNPPPQAQPGQTQPGQGAPGQTQPGQAQPGQGTPGQTQPGQGTPGQTQPGQGTPGQTQPGQGGQAQPGSGGNGQGGNGQGGNGQGGNGGGQDGNGNGRRQRGQGGNGQRGGRNRQPLAEQLKEPLSLTDDEVTKVKSIDDAFQAAMQKLRTDTTDRQARREKQTAAETQEHADIRAILDPGQQTKFDDWLKEQQNRRGQRGQRGQNGRGGDQQGRGGDPAARMQRLLDEAEKALTLSPEEKSAVMPLVKAVLEAKQTNRTEEEKRRTDLTDLLKNKATDATITPDTIAAKLKELRKANDDERNKIQTAQASLCEVLTIENEARLAALGIVDN
jgi:hypothetical protein